MTLDCLDCGMDELNCRCDEQDDECRSCGGGPVFTNGHCRGCLSDELAMEDSLYGVPVHGRQL